jgi:hypothetical protein
MPAAVPRKGTIRLILDESLKKVQGGMEEKRIRWSMEFEEDLPETTLPDTHLSFVLDSILQYAFVSTPPQGGIRISAKSVAAAIGTEKKLRPAVGSGGRVQIRVVLSDRGTAMADAGMPPGAPPFKAESAVPLELRLAGQVVRRHHGVMELETDEKDGRTSVFLKLPVERRRFF